MPPSNQGLHGSRVDNGRSPSQMRHGILCEHDHCDDIAVEGAPDVVWVHILNLLDLCRSGSISTSIGHRSLQRLRETDHDLFGSIVDENVEPSVKLEVRSDQSLAVCVVAEIARNA